MGENKMTNKNKQIESAGIFIMLLTVIGAIIYYTWITPKIDESVSVTLLIVIVPFSVGLYTNATNPQKAQVIAAL
jgi:uncharacterized membrane protein